MLSQKDFEREFMKLYETGISTTSICKKLNESRNRGYKFLQRKGLSSNKNYEGKYSDEVIEQLVKEYLDGATIQELQLKYPLYAGSLNKYLKLKRVTRRRGKISHCNPFYFHQIDSPQKAYFLGLLIADGSIIEKKNSNNKTLRIELQLQDKYILEEFAKAIGSDLKVKESFGNGKIYETNGKKYQNNKHECYFSIGNIDLIQDLISLGCVPRKSKTLKDLPKIPTCFCKDFILGFYDGDGIASVGQSHYMGFVGTQDFLKNITQQIYLDIGLPEPNVNYNRFNGMYYVSYTNEEHQKKLWKYFYLDTDYPVLKRKKDKMKKALNL